MSYGFRELAQVAALAAKYIGGVTHFRDRAGTDRPLYEPVPAAKQREALNILSKDLFDTASFRFKPEFLSRIAIDHFDRPSNPDFLLRPGELLDVTRDAMRVIAYEDVYVENPKAALIQRICAAKNGAPIRHFPARGN